MNSETEAPEVLVIDRSGWGSGPWDGEPDRIQWTDETTGLPCLIQRNHLGNLCGYVAVERAHPDHGKDYDAVDVNVHGGLTYANSCSRYICHVPEPGKPDDVWWFGFDAAHAWDLVPSMNRVGERFNEDVYRDVAYVRAEIESLAVQLRVRGAA